jgi:hypothetical protein
VESGSNPWYRINLCSKAACAFNDRIVSCSNQSNGQGTACTRTFILLHHTLQELYRLSLLAYGVVVPVTRRHVKRSLTLCTCAGDGVYTDLDGSTYTGMSAYICMCVHVLACAYTHTLTHKPPPPPPPPHTHKTHARARVLWRHCEKKDIFIHKS